MADFVPESTFQSDESRNVNQQQHQIQPLQRFGLQQPDYNQNNNNITNQIISTNGQISNYLTDSTLAYTKSTFTSHVNSYFDGQKEENYDISCTNKMTSFTKNSENSGFNNYTASNNSYQYCNFTNTDINSEEIKLKQKMQPTTSLDGASYYCDTDFIASSGSSWYNQPKEELFALECNTASSTHHRCLTSGTNQDFNFNSQLFNGPQQTILTTYNTNLNSQVIYTPTPSPYQTYPLYDSTISHMCPGDPNMHNFDLKPKIIQSTSQSDFSASSTISNDCILLNTSSSSSTTFSPINNKTTTYTIPVKKKPRSIQISAKSLYSNSRKTSPPACNLNSNYASSGSPSSCSSVSSLSSGHRKTKLKKKCQSMEGLESIKCGCKLNLTKPTPIAKRSHFSTHQNQSKKFKKLEIPIAKIIPNETVPSTVSPSSNCSYSSVVSTTSSVLHNLVPLTTDLFSQVESIKQLIRLASSEQAVKNLFSDLTIGVANYIIRQQPKNIKITPPNEIEIKINRQLIIAYRCLIDADDELLWLPSPKVSFLSKVSECDSSYDTRIKKILSRVYADSTKTKKCSENADKLFSSFEVADFNQSSCFPEFNLSFNGLQEYEVLNLTSFNESISIKGSPKTTSLVCQSTAISELKTLHFLLLLFTSLISLNSFVSKASASDLIENDDCVQASYCQRFLLKLLDHMCEDKNVKTRILLSVPEIEFF